jgi:pimeloyl-ACP methyl ester carboxylesterase
MSTRFEPIRAGYVYVPCDGYEYRVFYEEAGQGIPLLCLHNAGSDSRVWRHQLCDPDINRDFRVIAFDLPYHGKSMPPAGFQNHEYRLTGKFYIEFILAFCEALALERPVVMGCGIGGHVCLYLALYHEPRVRALIPIAASEHSPGWQISWLHHPEVNAAEAAGTWVFGKMAPQSPAEYRWESWWFFSQGGPGVYRGDLYFYSVEHDFRELSHQISGRVPIYFLNGEYDFHCLPEKTEAMTRKIRGAECTIMREIGLFAMSENPATFKQYLMPVLAKILEAERPAGGAPNARSARGDT